MSCKRVHVVGGGKHGNEVANATASVFTTYPRKPSVQCMLTLNFHRVIQVPGFAMPKSRVKK